MFDINKQAVILAILAAAGFSAKAIFVKLGYQEGMSTNVQLVWRMLLTLPFFIPLAIKAELKTPIRWQTKDFLTIFSIGLFGYYLASVFDFIGLRYISTSLERLTLFLNPTFVLLISTFLLGKRYGWKTWLGVAISYTGMALAIISSQSIEANENLVTGMLWILACAISYSIYMIILEFSVHRLGSTRTAAWGVILSTLFMLIHYFIAGGQLAQLWTHTTKAYIWMIGMALLSTVFPIWLLTKATGILGAGRTANISLIGPVLTMIFSVFILDEPITLTIVIGLMLVVSGVALTLNKNQVNITK